MMQDMMNNPMVQSLMSNPDFMSNIFESNPQMRAIMDSNPELRNAVSLLDYACVQALCTDTHNRKPSAQRSRIHAQTDGDDEVRHGSFVKRLREFVPTRHDCCEQRSERDAEYDEESRSCDESDRKHAWWLQRVAEYVRKHSGKCKAGKSDDSHRQTKNLFRSR